MSKNNRRQQTPKGRNYSLAMAMQDKRRGNSTQPIPSGKVNKRKPKYPGKWED